MKSERLDRVGRPWHAAIAALLVIVVAAPGQTPPGIQGRWRLDADKSDRPNAPGNKPGEAAPGRDDPVTNYAGVAKVGYNPIAVMALMRPPLTITIGVADSAVTLAPERGLAETILTDGRARTDTLLDGQERRIRAEWKKDRLVVEHRFTGVAETKDTYRLDPATGDLVVDAQVSPEHLRDRVRLRRVYRRVTGSGR